MHAGINQPNIILLFYACRQNLANENITCTHAGKDMRAGEN